MKKMLPSVRPSWAVFALLALALPSFLAAQKLPVRTVTMFKNGQSLIAKGGKVTATGGKFSTHDLPDALFGTYWVTSPTGDLASVFSRQDTLKRTEPLMDNFSLLQANMGQRVKIWRLVGAQSLPTELEGTLLQMAGQEGSQQGPNIILNTTDGRWVSFPVAQVQQIEFSGKPNIRTRTVLVDPYIGLDGSRAALSRGLQRTLEVNFKTTAKTEQDLSLLYLVNQLGWTPVYQLELNDRGKSRLTLRADLANDVEDLGDAELRLAVGVPNFTFAKSADWLMNFLNPWLALQGGSDNRYSRPQVYANQNGNYYSGELNEVVLGDGGGENFEANKAEDYFFYTVRPGNFPKNSRYQYPIFETEVEPAHFYECRLPGAGPSMFANQYQPRPDPNEQQNPVSHYVEFKNPTQFPFTTGAANILSQVGGTSFPISQDKLPYTPPGVKCKVRIADTPEIKVSHGEGETDRKENVRQYHNCNYDEVSVEGEICVVNHKDIPTKVRVRRTIEGMPIGSDRNWTQQQEQATLRINSMYEVEWELDLKPGEEQKWKYRYKVLVCL